MEDNLLIKKCDICKGMLLLYALNVCFYFCDSCFQIAHKNEETKSNKK